LGKKDHISLNNKKKKGGGEATWVPTPRWKKKEKKTAARFFVRPRKGVKTYTPEGGGKRKCREGHSGKKEKRAFPERTQKWKLQKKKAEVLLKPSPSKKKKRKSRKTSGDSGKT